MSFQNDIPIVQKVYEFYQDLYLTVEKMPKKDKYSLGQKAQNTTLDLLELVIEASNIPQREKLEPLIKGNTKTDLLKILVHLSYDTKAIDQKKYLKLEEPLQEIGRMLGGWIRSTKAS